MSETEASTSKAEASSDIDVEAATLLSQGRRHLLVEDSMKAVQCLQEACQLLGTKYGELADECGESYYYYGWALLEVARMETGVLGNALQGVPEDEEAEEEGGETDNVENPDKVEAKERKQIFHDVQDALEEETDEGQSETDKEGASEMETEDKETSKTKDEDKAGAKDEDKAGAKASESEKDGDTDEKVPPPSEKKVEDAVGKENKDAASKKASTAEDEKKDKDGDKPAEEKGMEVEDAEGKDKKQAEDGSGKDEAKEPVKDKSEAEEKAEDDGTEDEDGEEEEGAKGEDTKDDDISNFQLSWEMLELARIIFSKHDNDEFKLKVAQVYLKLGEHGLETGNYTQSIEDFSQCLTRQKEQLGNDSRLLAETHYNLALAYSFDQKFDKAIKSYEQSSVMIQNRIATLKKKATDTDKPLSEEEAKQNEKEIGELEALGPEIKAKIDDAKAEKNSAESAVGQAMRGAAAEFGLGTSSSSGFAPASCGEPAKPIAVRKATDTKPDDISYLVHRKRKPEDAPQEESSIKKSRQEDGGGDTTPSTNGVKNATNGDAELAKGDTKKSAEKEEIKVKQVEQASNSGTETAAMET